MKKYFSKPKNFKCKWTCHLTYTKPSCEINMELKDLVSQPFNDGLIFEIAY